MYWRVPARNLVEDHVGWDTRWPIKPMHHAEEAVVDEWMRHAGALITHIKFNDVVVTCSHRQRLGAEFGGTEQTFANQNFRMTFFRKIWIYLSHQPYLFLCLSVFTVWNVIYNIYGPFLTRKTSISDKKILDHTFFTQLLLSHASNNTTYRNSGGQMHGLSPTSNFGGDLSPSTP